MQLISERWRSRMDENFRKTSRSAAVCFGTSLLSSISSDRKDLVREELDISSSLERSSLCCLSL